VRENSQAPGPAGMLARSCDRVQQCFPTRAVGLIEPEDAGKMEPRHLTTFRAVAKALSFTRGALQLGYTQSRVTDQTKTLKRRAYRDRSMPAAMAAIR
jgi:hypothetical protein